MKGMNADDERTVLVYRFVHLRHYLVWIVISLDCNKPYSYESFRIYPPKAAAAVRFMQVRFM